MTPSADEPLSLEAWIAREAIPFSLDPSTSLDAAIDRMVAALGETVELLGFGEALHGGEEILQFRNSLFRRLVEAHGYGSIAIESSFTRGVLTDAYVSGSGPESYAAVQEAGCSHGFGELEANRELVEWMRHYNSAQPRVPLRFYGFDMPGTVGGPASPREALEVVLEMLAQRDPSAAGEHRERIEALLGPDSDWENLLPWMDPVTSTELLSRVTELRLETEDLLSTLHTRRPEWSSPPEADLFRTAEQYGTMVRQFLKFFVALARGDDYGASLGVRDALMAENLKYIAGRERKRGKVLVYAHNKHLQRGPVEWRIGPAVCTWWPAGAHTGARLGARYAVLGSAIGVSTENGLAPPEPGTLEAYLTAAPGPVRFVPVHPLRARAASWAAELPERSGSARNPSYFALSPQRVTDFDGWIAFDTATYPRGARALP